MIIIGHETKFSKCVFLGFGVEFEKTYLLKRGLCGSQENRSRRYPKRGGLKLPPCRDVRLRPGGVNKQKKKDRQLIKGNPLVDILPYKIL